MKNKVLLALSAGVVAALALSGCASHASASGTKVLTVGSTTATNSLDPVKSASGAPSRWYIDPAYASVLQIDAKDNSVVAGLADKWGYVGSDNRRFTFTLRSGLKFADGSPLNAKAAIASFIYFQKNGAGPTHGYYSDWTFAATSTDTVEITTKAPNSLIPTLLTPDYMFGDLISPAGLANPSKLQAQTFGAGPYELSTAQTIAGDHYTYVPNKNYYDASGVHFSKIVAKVIPNLTQAVQALKTGQIQAMTGDSTVAASLTGGNVKTLVRSAAWSGLYLFDRDGSIVPALKSLQVRQAMNYAVDRGPLVSAVYGKYATASSELAGQGSADYGFVDSLNNAYPYDPGKAKELLKQAGYGKGFSIPVFYEAYVPAEAKMAQVLADQYSKVGITLQLKPEQSFSSWVTDLYSKKYAGTTFTGGGTMFANVQWFLPGGALNPFNVSVPEINAQYSKLIAASSASEQASTAAGMTKVLTDTVPAVGVAQIDAIYAYDSSKISGFEFNGKTPIVSTIVSWTSK